MSGIEVAAIMAITAGAVVAITQQPAMQQSDYSVGINTSGTDVEIPVCYGLSKTGCHRVFDEPVMTKDGNDTLTVVYSFSEGPVHSIQQIYIDELPLFLVEKDYTTGTIGQLEISSVFNQHVQVQFSNGERGGYRYLMAEENSDGKWDETFLGQGIASICLKIKLDQTEGHIKGDNFSVRIKSKGRLVRDIRVVGEPRVYQTATTTAGTNPALVMYDYLTDADYGCGYRDEQVDQQSFIEAANWCDANNVRFNGVVNQKQSYKKNLEFMLTSMNAAIVEINGRYYCLMDTPGIVQAHFDDSNTQGKFTANNKPASRYFNQLEVSWMNPEIQSNKDVSVYPPCSNTDARIQRDGKIITNRLELPFTSDKDTVDFLASFALRKADYSCEVQFTAMLDGFFIKPFDIISVSRPELKQPEWSNRLFRVMSLKPVIFGAKAGTVEVTAVEYNDAVYDQPLIGETSTAISNPTEVPAPYDLSFSFMEGRYGVTGDLKWQSSIRDIRETLVLYKLSAEPDTSYQLFQTVQDKHCIITGLTDARYDFKVINRDMWNRTSAAAYLLSVDASDKTQFPKVTGLQVTQQNTPDFVYKWDDMLERPVQVQDVNRYPNVIGSGKVKDYFLNYEVRVYKAGVLVHSAVTTIPEFKYRLADNAKTGLNRRVKIDVCIKGKAGAKSQPVAVEALNNQQKVPSGIEVYGGLSGLNVKFDAPTEPDHKGVLVYMSTTRGFTPTLADLFADLSQTNYLTRPVMDKGTYFIRLAAYDCFGQDGLVFSGEKQASIVDVDSLLAGLGSDTTALFELLSSKASQSSLDQTEQHAQEAFDKALSEATRVLDLAKADDKTIKAELKAVIDSVAGSLALTDARVTTVEQTVTTKDAAMATRVNQVLAKTNTNLASITSLTKTVTNNNSSATTQLNAVTAKTASNLAEINRTNKTVTDNNTAVTAQLNTLTSKTTSNLASINQTNQTAATNQTAITSQLNTLTSKTSTNASSITGLNSTVTTLNNAQTTQVNAVKAIANKAAADIKTTNTTVASNQSALLSSITTMESNVKQDSSTKVAQSEARSTANINAKYNQAVKISTDQNTAQASLIGQLTTAMNNNRASITSTQQLINTVDGKVNAKVGLSLDVNGKIAGWASTNNGTSSSFAIQADKFLVSHSGTDHPVFAIENGRLVVKTAMIGVLDSANIKAGAIDTAHLSATTINAVRANLTDANIVNASIGFAKIRDDIHSNGFVLNKSGWQITKAGALNAMSANIQGTIHGSHIKGSFVEGSIIFGSEGYLQRTQSDRGYGTRYGCFERLSYTASVTARPAAWSEYATIPMCSHDYSSDGATTIGTYAGSTVVLANNYNRSRLSSLSTSAQIEIDTSVVNSGGRSRSVLNATFRTLVEVSGVRANGTSAVIATHTITNDYLGTINNTTRAVFPLRAGWGGSLTVQCEYRSFREVDDGDGNYHDEYTYGVKSAYIDIKSMPSSINYSGNYRLIRYRFYTEIKNSYTAQQAHPHVANIQVTGK
ncbi:phage tail tip fiber protein [Shewanella frigidimarina]|uniref:phage tail tip fiber protein n=1 Tax=Shewanella frigidimarina TaxID=56812 RepID=UPI003D7B1D1F